MKSTMCWGALLLFSLNLQAACQDMVRTSWNLLPKNKTITWLKDFKTEKICAPLPDITEPNVILKAQLGSKTFERKILIPLSTYWDSLENGKLIGGVRHNQEILFESHIPKWAKKAELIIVDIKTGKILGQGTSK